MQKTLFLAIIAITFGTTVISTASNTEKPLKVWNYSYLKWKNIRFTASKGNKTKMRVSSDVKSPDGQKSLEISLNEFKFKSVPWDIQLRYVYDGGLKAGHSYEISFPCKASASGTLQLVAAQAGKPWKVLPGTFTKIELTKDWQMIKLVFSVKKDSLEPLAVPRIMLGRYGQPATLYFGPATFWDSAEKPAVVLHENLIFNSSFELGDTSYNYIKYLYPPNNPKMKYEGPVLDTSTFVSGKQSMKLPNRFAEEVRLYTHEVNMQANMKYTFSVWLKADKPNTRVKVKFLSAAKNNSGWTSLGKSFTINTKWQRYTYTFKTNQNAAFNPYLLWITFGTGLKAQAVTVWADDLQLDQGEPQPYKAGADIEFVCIPKDNFIISENSRTKVINQIRTSNNSLQDVKTTFVVSAVNDYSGKTTFSKRLNVLLKPGEIKKIDLEIPVHAYGSYIINGNLDSPVKTKFRSYPSCFGVIGKYERKPIDLDKDFCVGFNGPSSSYDFRTQLLRKPGAFRAMGCSQDNYAKRLAQMGCRLLRDWQTIPKMFDWSLIERTEGKFDFQYADRNVDLFLRHGIKTLPVLDPGFIYKKSPNRTFPEPKWMRKMRKNGKRVNGIVDYSHKTLDFRLVPIKKWKSFVNAVVSHFKTKISHYEIVNEPNLKCPSAKVYVDYLKAAFEVIRKVSPDAKVVGFCSTGDKGGNVERFFKKCFEIGGLKYADIASWHPYFARELSSKIPADKQIADVKALASKYGKANIPLWNTELYWLRDMTQDSDYKPSYAARRFLTDLGEGIAQSMPTMDYKVWKNLLTPNFGRSSSVIQSFQLLPSAKYVCFNALARFFEGAKPIGKYRWVDRAICYSFERDGEFLAAFWNYTNMGGIQAKLPDNAGNIQLFDMFGNKLPFNDRTLNINYAPCYLKWKNGSADSVRTALSNAIIVGKKPFNIERALFLKGADKLLLSICNMSGKIVDNMSVSVNNVKVETGKFMPMKQKKIKLDSKTVNGDKDLINVNILGGDKPFSSIKTLNKVKYLRLMENKESEELPIRGVAIGNPASTKDLSAAFTIKREHDDLILHVKVKDDKRSQPSKAIFNEDALQIYLDAFPMQTSASFPAYAKTTYKLVVGVWRKEEIRINAGAFPGMVKAEVKPISDGYEVKVQIPLASIPKFTLSKGKMIGFDISVEDSDATSRKTELVWNGTVNNWRNRSQFGILEFQ